MPAKDRWLAILNDPFGPFLITMRLQRWKYGKVLVILVDNLIKAQPALKTVTRMHRLGNNQNIAGAVIREPPHQAACRCACGPVVDTYKILINAGDLTRNKGNSVDASFHQAGLRVTDLRATPARLSRPHPLTADRGHPENLQSGADRCREYERPPRA